MELFPLGLPNHLVQDPQQSSSKAFSEGLSYVPFLALDLTRASDARRTRHFCQCISFPNCFPPHTVSGGVGSHTNIQTVVPVTQGVSVGARWWGSRNTYIVSSASTSLSSYTVGLGIGPVAYWWFNHYLLSFRFGRVSTATAGVEWRSA